MSDNPKVRVLAFSGSLRKASFNSALLRAAAELAPKEMELEIFDLRGIPLYDEDLRTQGVPAEVTTFREKISSANAVLIATPEYNYSIPGVLKNALDWASRPPNQPFAGKPVAIVGASTGGFGTVRAQLHLRQVCVFLDLRPINKPELHIARCQEKFDADLRLTDETLRKTLADLLETLGKAART